MAVALKDVANLLYTDRIHDDQENFDQRIRDTNRALKLCHDFIQKFSDDPAIAEQQHQLNHPDWLGANLSGLPPAVLWKAKEFGMVDQYAAELYQLRAAYRILAEDLEVATDARTRYQFVRYSLPSVSYWTETPTDAVAAAKRLLQIKPDEHQEYPTFIRGGWRSILVRELSPSPPVPEKARKYYRRYVFPRILVSHDGTESASIRRIWTQFAEQLAEEEDFYLKGDGLMLLYYLNLHTDGEWPIAGRVCDHLWENRDNLELALARRNFNILTLLCRPPKNANHQSLTEDSL